MKIAYIVLAHRYPEQLIRLIHRLNTENASFFVHFDKKTDDKTYQELVSGLSHLPNVYFLKRYTCYWGDFSIVKASLEGIKEIFRRNIQFDWLIFLSGQDYPVKSTRQIEQFFQENEGKVFIQYVDNSVQSDGLWPTRNYDNIDYWHFRLYKLRFVFPGALILNSYNRYCKSNQTWFRLLALLWSGLMFLFPIKVKRKFPDGLEPFRGSQFCCLPRECVEYVHNLIQENSPVVNFFKYVDIPDELFFQTIIINSPFKDKVINDNLFYIDWDNPNPSRPRVFVKSDFERLVNSSKLFARKFDLTRDANIFDMLDQNTLEEAK
jgi:hypothetical protein